MRDSWNHFLNTDLKEQFIQEINRALDKELKKPAKKRDYDKIEELTQTYTELMGADSQVEASMQCCISEFKSKARPKPKITRRMRIVLAVVSVAIMLFVMNIITVSAFNMNVFSFIVHVADDGFEISSPSSSSEISDADMIELPVSSYDPYGMIAECAKYGIYPETPHYLPENYVLTVCNYTDMPLYMKWVKFTFRNRHNARQFISLDFELFENEESIGNAHFPNVEHCLSEIEINGNPAILAEEQKDTQFHIVYPIDKLLIVIFTQNVPQEEVNQMINSII